MNEEGECEIVPYRQFRASGVTFVLKYDEADPTILHIFARHLTSPADAMRVFFAARPTWNETHQRFESMTDTHGLYWYWIDEAKRVAMVVSCFARQ